MRNLKRALSLAMATFMLLGMMVVGAGAVSISDFSDGEKIVNQEAVTVLTTLNVLNGRDDGSYDPEGVVNRAEMAKMICVVLNGGRTPQLGTSGSTFTDVAGTNAAWAEPFIAYCANLGIIAGYGDGTFKPTATVTAAEASKMLLVALGYKADVEGYVGADWQINVDVAANQNNLYNGLATLNTNDGLSRDNAAQMVFNALNAQMVAYTYVITGTADNSITTKPQITTENLSTLLVEKFKADKLEAVVLSNDTAALDNNYSAADDAGETTLAIVSANGKTLDNPFVDTYKVATTEEMLGQRVALYVKNNTNTVGYDADNTIVIGTPIVVNRNKVIESTDGTKSGKLAGDNNLSIDSNTQYFVNYGGYYGGLLYGNDPAEASTVAADVDNTVKTMTQAQFDVEAALTGVSVKLIDNDGDKKVDYALAVKYSYGSVNKYSTTDDGALRIQGLFNEDEYEAADVVGFDDVAKDDFVLFTEYGGRIYVQKPETMEGKLENYSTSKKNVKLDGETIDWSGLNGTRFNEMQYINDYVLESGVLNTSAVYYKDINGYIFGVAETDESTLTYAVLMGFENQTSASTGKLGTDAKARLLFADGTLKTYEVSTIDGKKVTNCTALDSTGTYAVPKDKNEIGFADVDQFNVYSYSLNENGTVKLSSKSANMLNRTESQTIRANQSANVGYAKGASTMSMGSGLSNYTITDKTVFLYSKTDGSVARFQGRTAPSIDKATTTQVSVRFSGRGEALVVFLNKEDPSADFKDNFAYVYNTRVSENGDAYEVKAIIDGKIETYLVDMAFNAAGAKTIRPDAGTGKHTIDVGLYNYSKDGNVYTLTQKNVTVNSDAGSVTNVTGGYIRVDNRISYTVTTDTKFLESRTDKTAGENASVSNGDAVSVVFDDDMKAIYVFLTKFSYEGGSTPSGGGSIIVDGSEVTGTKMSAYDTAADINKALLADNVILDGNWTNIAASKISIPNGRTLVVKGNLTESGVGGELANSGTVIVTGTYTPLSGTTVIGTVKAGNMVIAGGTTLNGATTVAGNITGAGTLTVASGASLTVGGDIGTSSAKLGAITATGAITRVTNVYSSGIVNGTVTASGKMEATSTANLAADVISVNGNITLSGAPTVNGTLNAGSLDSTGKFSVGATGNVTIKGDLDSNVAGVEVKGGGVLTAGDTIGDVTLTKGTATLADVTGVVVALEGTLNTGKITGTLATNGAKDVTIISGNIAGTGTVTVNNAKADVTVGDTAGLVTLTTGTLTGNKLHSLTVADGTAVANEIANTLVTAAATTEADVTINGKVGGNVTLADNAKKVLVSTGDITGVVQVTNTHADSTVDLGDVTGNFTSVSGKTTAGNVVGAVVNTDGATIVGNVTGNVTLTDGTLSVNNVTGTLAVALGKTLTLNGKATGTGVIAGGIFVASGAELTLDASAATTSVAVLTGDVGGVVKVNWTTSTQTISAGTGNLLDATGTTIGTLDANTYNTGKFVCDGSDFNYVAP